MNNRQVPPPGDQSALSLLVNAADNHDPRMQRDLGGGGGGGGVPGRSLAETLRLRGLAGDPGAASLEEQLLLQQQAQGYGSQNLLSQLREQNLLSQLGQQQQLAALLGLGGAPASAADHMRSALAAAQRRQQVQAPAPQFSHADLLALSRSGALPGLSGILGGSLGVGAGGGLASELEGLQRIEELERRQRLLNQSSAGAPIASTSMPRMDQQAEAPQMHAAPTSAARVQSSELRAAEAPASPAPERRPSESVASASAEEAPPNEEVEKTPGSVIVPCRARGMPMDHNFKVCIRSLSADGRFSKF